MEKYRTRQPAHPGAVVQRLYLRPLEWSTEATAEALGLSQEQLQVFLYGLLDVDATLAQALATHFQTTPELWRNLQAAYDAYQSGKPYCKDCRSVGMIHCHEPEHCTGMIYPPETPRTETTSETPMTDEPANELTIPQDQFDMILFDSVTRDMNLRTLIMEVPGVYELVCAHYHFTVFDLWSRSIFTSQSIPAPTNAIEPQDDLGQYCRVCEEELPHGHCAWHPYAEVYEVRLVFNPD